MRAVILWSFCLLLLTASVANAQTPTPAPTETPIVFCTPPPCQNGSLVCGNPNGCPGGCGTICLMPEPGSTSEPISIPEPVTFVLFGMGLSGVARYAVRQRQRLSGKRHKQ